MKLHFFRGVCVAAALACLNVPTIGRAAVVTGTDSGVFVNPSWGSVTTGVGTSHFTYGDPNGFGTGPNSLTYAAANPISSTTETPFKLGTLTYYNGTTSVGTTPDHVDLKINLHLTQPGMINQNFTFTLDLMSTPNTGNSNQNADYVYFPSSYSSTTFMAGGQTYTLQLLGFANVVGDGFLQSNSSELHVRESGTATADLMGMVTTHLSPVPEPTSIASGAVACLFGLVGMSRRARKAARA